MSYELKSGHFYILDEIFLVIYFVHKFLQGELYG